MWGIDRRKKRWLKIDYRGGVDYYMVETKTGSQCEREK